MAHRHNKTQAKTSTVESGETPIVLDWDYLNVGNAAEFKTKAAEMDEQDRNPHRSSAIERNPSS